ncbi:phosphate signaling complex protein PhoU [Virgibacillus sp. 179-BFC.A HS]|uniref:Phosphate-specific transport system accessory protein PhoU n=1 Tax=Tigheibacillus jepli TaxID=3035914 RepID=A0ABU5CEP0_9BACI|nr:phosphate signaling complex protein PhoU [Virgibacillus sp. 179-BFC.A HS]MDY0404294.1 phosphate signaling complex protein PhoU [Virgibacillus sp. 179-BFC.A HS]
MQVRQNFENELQNLKDTLLHMVELARNAVMNSLEALQTQDMKLAEDVISSDLEINRLDEQINQTAISMIAQQQPVASDLRKIIVALRISTDVERVGDLGVNIAKSTLRIEKKKVDKPMEDILQMATIAQKMVHDALNAYHNEDLQAALDLAKEDDQIDVKYGRIIQELLKLAAQNPTQTAQITQLAFICRDIERVGDHATNIAENIIYMIKGKQYNLN